MRTRRLYTVFPFASRLATATGAALVSSPGETAAIPSWDLQSTASVGTDLGTLSRTGLDTASWHHVSSSKCTLMGCLIQAGVYNETELFYSDNLLKVDDKQFSVPWIYRHEFSLQPAAGQHFFLQTHGISSRADIFLNGQQVASSSEQAGAYAGQTYEITKLVGSENALAIQVHPTDYYRDFAVGFVDWNPWPADNGTGVWRDVEVKQTGPVMLEPLRVVTQLGTPLGISPANVTLKARAHNLENSSITVTVTGLVAPVSGGGAVIWTKALTLPPLSVTDIVLDTVVHKPAIWWPRQWGEQPLYNAKITVTTADGGLSDAACSEFGFRSVTRTLNSFNDTAYYVNGHPFQVIGGGYSSDIFLRWDTARWETQLRYVLDLGFNTVRLEGKNEHPELYSTADRLGVMIMPGWECCDKWEAWSYNDNLAVPSPIWSAADYAIANQSMLHEAAMLQPHPSVLTYLIGSDFWPDERATALYLAALRSLDWPTPVVCSAANHTCSAQTGPSGMRMDGPYDWVPPSYWQSTPPASAALAAPFAGFNTELSPGGGTPPLASLSKFLSPADLDALWRDPSARLFHMSRAGSSFETRGIFDAALAARWGAPAGLADYLLKAQLMDYEAVRAQGRSATGMVYWMCNAAWPGLHWQLWDWYMRPAGAYFGAKVGGRLESVVWDAVGKAVWLVNRSLHGRGHRQIAVDVLRADGRVVYRRVIPVQAMPNRSRKVLALDWALWGVRDVVFLRLVLTDGKGTVLSRNVYWVADTLNELDWDNTNWYVTPVTRYADYTALNRLAPARVWAVAVRDREDGVAVILENKSRVPAFFVSLNLVDRRGQDVLPLTWDDNYVTLWPRERMTLRAKAVAGTKWEPAAVEVEGKNVGKQTVPLSYGPSFAQKSN
ncbi:476ac709-e0be-4bd8-9454-2dc5d423726d [Thermothielavioides terrestris]|uniref:476ac709-e0be-4bd8-9454-2dc5d423726d n=1 Tax=Thermothielavioides terrestris TaxID=2587410 RepID=A0A446BTB8_9PEZI|nr:476ac709-e0be-4bd8-9454-2dc5d423726d [Thermothielavioides terrestris]